MLCRIIRLLKSDQTVTVDALKLAEDLSRYLQRPATSKEGEGSADDTAKAVTLWERLLDGPLEAILAQSSDFTRALACDCFAGLGSAGFAGLQVRNGDS